MKTLEPVRINRCMVCHTEHPIDKKQCPVCGGKLLLFTNPPSAEQRLNHLEERMDTLERRNN